MFLPVIFLSLLVFHGAVREEEESDEVFALVRPYLSLERKNKNAGNNEITSLTHIFESACF